MKIATILFTYNRPVHTIKVLEALKSNTVMPEKLFIFHDGKKANTNETEWAEVEKIINSVDWCEKEIVTSNINKGLANSVIDGVNYAFEQSDAVIVLEDDCLPRKNFMKYMVDVLNYYADKQEVYAVSGWSPLTNIPQDEYDIYLTGRIDSWGWGTWKDNWKYFSTDYTILGRIKNNEELNKRLEIWGRDLENFLIGNIYGRCNSWATLWGLKVIEQKGYCVVPYKSFICNIGFDGSGVHCINGDLPSAELCDENQEEFKFIDDLIIKEKTIEEYKYINRGVSSEFRAKYYRNILVQWNMNLQDGKSIKKYLSEKNVKRIMVWGKNDLTELLINEMPNDESVTLMSTNDFFANKSLYNGLFEETDLIILIPGYDLDYISYLIGNKYSMKLSTLEQLVMMMI